MGKNIDDLLRLLASAPPGPRAQIDEQITSRLKALIGKPPAEQATRLKTILDDCAYAALASDFAMMAMEVAWKLARSEQGEG